MKAMISSITIENFLFIKKISINLSANFVAIMGETGSGKSVLIDCINFALGSKVHSNDIIYRGAEFAKVTLIIKSKDKDIIIIRQIFSDHKDIITVNDVLFKHEEVLKNIGSQILICGQFSQTKLYTQSEHKKILDSYGGIQDMLIQMSRIFTEYKKSKKRLDQLKAMKDDSLQKIIFYSQMIEDISSLNLKDDEETNLLKMRNLIANDSKIQASLLNALSAINSNKVINNIETCKYYLIQAEKLSANQDTRLSDLLSTVTRITSDIIELQAQLDQISGKENFNIEEIDERIQQIRSISRKYSVTSNELSNLLIHAKDNISVIQDIDQKIMDCEINLNTQFEESMMIANQISEARSIHAVKLEEYINNTISSLGLSNARFAISISKGQLSINGYDNIIFTASMNLGSPIKPIDQIASGGELSRLTLAIQSAISETHNISSIIFDEIDTGVSGAIASMIGKKLQNLSKYSQIIVITHSPQIISHASQHFYVKKMTDNNQTIITASEISEDNLIIEISKMLSGNQVTENAKSAALDLLKYAKNIA